MDLARLVYRRSGLKRMVQTIKYERDYKTWLRFKAQILNISTARSARNILIIPPDPLLVSASLGDQAMLITLKTHILAAYPGHDIYIATASSHAADAVHDLGCKPIIALNSGRMISALQAVAKLKPVAAVLMGADVIDGHADPLFSQQLIAMLDIAAATGAKARVCGFSFSKAAWPKMGRAFDTLSHDVPVIVRDPHSLERLDRITARPLMQGADMAFMLQPVEPEDHTTIAWIDCRKASGDKVIGFNIHPLLFRNSNVSYEQAIANVCEAFRILICANNTSILLIPHDYRGSDADDIAFSKIIENLVEAASPRLCHMKGCRSSQEVKFICSKLDGVISGRMHLLIATLGVATPALGISYNNKFSGLLELFNLDQSTTLINRKELLDGKHFIKRISNFLANLEQLRIQVTKRLDYVQELSSQNFKNI